PLYQIAINFFVMPIALAGLVMGYSASDGDTFLLTIPRDAGSPALSAMIFLAGFSAATGMVMMASIAISIMVSNHLFLPVVERYEQLHWLRRHILLFRQITIAVLLLLGLAFATGVGGSYMLINIGLVAFTAILQFAPIIIGGLYWQAGTLKGAMAGLSAGIALWGYTTIVPAFCRSGLFNPDLLELGPWGVAALKPEGLLGLGWLDPISHTVFWSMAFNIFFYVLISVLLGADTEEQKLTSDFFHTSDEPLQTSHKLEANIHCRSKLDTAVQILGDYMPQEKAELLAQACFTGIDTSDNATITLVELANINRSLEQALSGAIGTAAAHHAIARSDLFNTSETYQLRELYSDILANLHIAPDELRR
ncbi:MAG: hypothetical protein VXZ35_02125, partial [Pseudomonadota bacterium]|nr:hypothetical protein [Pseudomonadota bacterium]